MKILLYGASGTIGAAIAAELTGRGHSVTPVTRSAAAGDVTDAASVAALTPGHDAVISAIGPRYDNGDDPKIVSQAARALIDGLRASGIRRLIVVGGAGGLTTADGSRVIDGPDFPDAWKPIAAAHIDAYDILSTATDIEWTVATPAALIEPGPATGTFRTGRDALVTAADGSSRLTTGDFANLVADAVTDPGTHRSRITAAY
jgi:uncharacterized protein